jgi:hypothetical protein
MRTIEVCLYKFDELSEEAKENALSNITIDNSFWYQKAHETVKKFHDVFGTREGYRSWLDIRTEHMDDAILSLNGFRLQKYLWNNFGDTLFKGRYFSLWSKKDVSYKYYKEGYPVLKVRYSKVMKQNCCVLTGVCYDEDLLKPIYDFLKVRDFSRNSSDFKDLLEDCVNSLRNSLDSEDEYNETDEAKINHIEINDYEFDEDGNRA